MKHNNKKGFTLVELIIVIAVMALLVAIAIPTVGNVVESARKTTNDTNAATLESGIKNAYAQRNADLQKSSTGGQYTWTQADLKEEVEKLKLAVKDRTFYFDSVNEKVYVADGDARAYTNQTYNFMITYDSNGTVDVSAGSATPTSDSGASTN